MIRISQAQEEDRRHWDAYLATNSVDHHAFSWNWRAIIGDAFGHTSYYLVAEDDSSEEKQILGILPLFHVKSMLFGTALISVPYLNAGGVLADSEEAAASLLSEAKNLAAQLEVDYLELRHRRELGTNSTELTERTHKVSMLLQLQENPEELFSSFRPKLRSQIRRPSKSGIYAEVSSRSLSDEASLAAFYSVFSEHMRDLGTPVYPQKLFDSVMQHFGESCRIISVWHKNKAVAAGLTLGHHGCVEIPWASSLTKANRMSPNMLLYWEAIKTACLDGYQIFDFGRSSPEGGTYRFKEQWGSKPLTLHWYYHVLQGEIPDVNPKSPKYSALVGCWKRLPLPVANLIGPRITRSLP